MEHIFSYLLLLMIISLGMLAPKSKVVKYIVMTMIFVFIAFSRDTYDLVVYLREYQAVGQGGASDYEVLCVLLWKIGNFLGLTYFQFRGILAAFELLVMDRIISSQTKYTAYVWTLYLVFSAILDAFLMRYFLGMIFALLALKLVYTKQKYSFRDVVFFLLWTVLAGLSHSSFWLLLTILPLSLVKNKIKLILIAVATIGVFSGSLIDMVIKVYSNLVIREYTIVKYFSGGYANVNGLIYDTFMMILFMSPAIITWLLYRRGNRSHGLALVEAERLKTDVYLWMTLNILLCVILPVRLIAVNYSRFLRVLAIINYVFISKMMMDFPRNRRLYKWGGLFYAAVLLFWTMVVDSSSNSAVWTTMFEQNLFFKWLN